VAVVVSDNSADLTVARVWSQKLGATDQTMQLATLFSARQL
jgi:hypothetical protein